MNYRIFYDIDLDAWNWSDAAHHNCYGQDWRKKLSSSEDLTFFDQLKKMPFAAAEKFAQEYLAEKHARSGYFSQKNPEEFEQEIMQIDADFAPKFAKLCEILEKITRKKLFYQKYDIKVTTFPKGPYNFEEHFFGYFINNDFSLAQTFLHEVLHFQFIAYWRRDENSPVAKLSDDEFNFLNESLIVVLYDYEDFIGKVFRGHPAQQEFMKILRQNWVKSRDFDELVDSGLKRLPEYI